MSMMSPVAQKNYRKDLETRTERLKILDDKIHDAAFNSYFGADTKVIPLQDKSLVMLSKFTSNVTYGSNPIFEEQYKVMHSVPISGHALHTMEYSWDISTKTGKIIRMQTTKNDFSNREVLPNPPSEARLQEVLKSIDARSK